MAPTYGRSEIDTDGDWSSIWVALITSTFVAILISIVVLSYTCCRKNGSRKKMNAKCHDPYSSTKEICSKMKPPPASQVRVVREKPKEKDDGGCCGFGKKRKPAVGPQLPPPAVPTTPTPPEEPTPIAEEKTAQGITFTTPTLATAPTIQTMVMSETDDVDVDVEKKMREAPSLTLDSWKSEIRENGPTYEMLPRMKAEAAPDRELEEMPPLSLISPSREMFVMPKPTRSVPPKKPVAKKPPPPSERASEHKEKTLSVSVTPESPSFSSTASSPRRSKVVSNTKAVRKPARNRPLKKMKTTKGRPKNVRLIKKPIALVEPPGESKIAPSASVRKTKEDRATATERTNRSTSQSPSSKSVKSKSVIGGPSIKEDTQKSAASKSKRKSPKFKDEFGLD